MTQNAPDSACGIIHTMAATRIPAGMARKKATDGSNPVACSESDFMAGCISGEIAGVKTNRAEIANAPMTLASNTTDQTRNVAT